MAISLLLIVASMLVIWRASDGFETASEYLGKNLSDGVRGATINAIGSSMPELFTTFIGLIWLKEADAFAFGVGTTAGSAIFNSMVIPAVVIIAVIMYKVTTSVELSRKVILRDGLSLLIAEAILIVLISGDTLSWWHGLILMLTYGAYVVFMFSTMSKSDDETDGNEMDDDDDDDDDENSSIFKSIITLDLEAAIIRTQQNKMNSWVLLIISMLIIGLACAFLVTSCEKLAEGMGLAPYFIAVVLASAATSVPDTIISVKDAFNGEYDDAVANALGSNIFDVCFALGLPLFIYTLCYGQISMDPETVKHIAELRGVLFVLTLVTFLIFVSNKSLKTIHAILLISLYLIFTFYVVSRAYEFEWAEGIATFFHQLLIR